MVLLLRIPQDVWAEFLGGEDMAKHAEHDHIAIFARVANYPTTAAVVRFSKGLRSRLHGGSRFPMLALAFPVRHGLADRRLRAAQRQLSWAVPPAIHLHSRRRLRGALSLGRIPARSSQWSQTQAMRMGTERALPYMGMALAIWR